MTLFFYFLKELLPQFFTTLCVLSAVIVISQLIRLSEVLVTFGLTAENILLPFLFIMLPFLAFTIPIAFMFAVLLAFSRFSADGEYTAMLASGYSLSRAAVPVLLIGTILYGAAAYCAMNFEPWGRRETIQFYHRKTQTELDNMIKVKLKPGVFLDDFLGYVLYAEEISQDRTQFKNVMLAPGSASVNQNFTLLAPRGSVSGSVETGDLRMEFASGVIYTSQPSSDETSVVRFERSELDLIRIFQEQIFGADAASDDYRSFRPVELWNYIGQFPPEETLNEQDRKVYLKARYLFHQRLGLPFSCITFALFAMVLGIQDERRGKGFGYLGSILTIILGYVFLMTFKFAAEKGQIAAPLAAWIPNLILLGFGSFLVFQKNRLPPSESAFDPRHFPGIKRFSKG
ncbi:MAG: YjgP/YjgQ family permease [Pseudobacteriovorax sp.]|nr:YjgP/YjgQ family permease [Pseudobacteriovorax sp.]